MNIPTEYQKHEKLAQAYRKGFNHGNGFACNNVPKLGETYRTDASGKRVADADNIREIHEELCFDAESSSRDFSPFEFIAHEFNSADLEAETEGGPASEELREAFEEGIADSIRADLATYTDEDYGIPSWDNPPEGMV